MHEGSKDLLNNWSGFGVATSLVYHEALKPSFLSLADHSQNFVARSIATLAEATFIPQYVRYKENEEQGCAKKLGIGEDKWDEWSKRDPDNWLYKHAKSATARSIVEEDLSQRPNTVVRSPGYLSLSSQGMGRVS